MFLDRESSINSSNGTWQSMAIPMPSSQGTNEQVNQGVTECPLGLSCDTTTTGAICTKDGTALAECVTHNAAKTWLPLDDSKACTSAQVEGASCSGSVACVSGGSALVCEGGMLKKKRMMTCALGPCPDAYTKKDNGNGNMVLV